MASHLTPRICRSLGVWLAVTAAAMTGAWSAPAAWAAVRPGAGDATFADLLVTVCATALLMALVWLWVVTTVTVADLLTGRLRTGGGTIRRLVLVACGAAVLAGTTSPALAAGDGSSILAGLSLPDRSVATNEISTVPRRPASRPRLHVVRPGESLWSIAEATSAVGDPDQRWRAIWSANRDVIGDDPDLILPGQALRLPDDDTDTETHSDKGER